MITPEEQEKPEERIKKLLLSEELDLLEELRRRCDFLGDRVEDDSSIRETIRPVIIDVLRDAGVEDHERMARVLAPLVLASMREEIRNSSDMMVDALYPITGKLVAAAVSNAFREMLETLNEKLESNFSVARLQARIKSWTTGQSEAEILLQRNPPFSIDELLVIHAPTGLLIAHAGSEQESGPDAKTALIGSMLTAIISFVRDAISDDRGDELRTLSFGESQLFIRTSPGIVLAVRANGTKPAGFDNALELLFNDFLSRWSPTLAGFDGSLREDDSIAIVNDLKARFNRLQEQRRRKFRGSSRKPLVFLAAPLVLLVAWIGYQYADSRRIAGIEQTALEIVGTEEALHNFEVSAHYDSQNSRLVVGGLFPELALQERLATAFRERLPEVEVEFRTRFLSNSEIKSLSEKLTEIENSVTNLNQLLGDFRNESDKTERSIDRLTDTVNEQKKDLQTQIADALEVDPIVELRQWTQGQRIQFTDGLQIEAPNNANAKLKALAGLLRAVPSSIGVHVVGYSDIVGNDAANLRISSERAAAVAERLIELGVRPEQLVTVGRANERLLSSAVGTGSINRRVEFEVYRSN